MSDAMLLLRAAASWLASLATVATAMLLRADSAGPRPGWPTLVVAMAVLAAVFYPMTASRRRLPAFVASLIALQLMGHALLLYAATGQISHDGASGLFCCASTPYAGHGGLVAALTANAGWLLFFVQLAVVTALAIPLRLLHSVFLALAHALATIVNAVAPLLSGLLRLLAFRAFTPPATRPPTSPRRLGSSGRAALGAVGRRGPPHAALVRSSHPLPLVPWVACS